MIENVEVHNEPWSIHWLSSNNKNSSNTAENDETESEEEGENEGEKDGNVVASRKASKKQRRKIAEVDVIRGFVLNKTPAKVITYSNDDKNIN